jgi:predicted transcriptional regulator
MMKERSSKAIETERLLNNRYTAKCLSYIGEKSEIKKTELLRFCNANALSSLLKDAESANLVEIREEKHPQTVYKINLTKKGEDVVNMYKRIEDIMSEKMFFE